MSSTFNRPDRNLPQFGQNIVVEKSFLGGWEKLSQQQKAIVRQKIQLLVANPSHPSLRCHALKRSMRGLWSCYVSIHYRILFFKGSPLTLHQIGPYGVVERYCRHRPGKQRGA